MGFTVRSRKKGGNMRKQSKTGDGSRGRPRKTFVSMLKNRRIDRGLEQQDLAALLDVHYSAVSHWEAGRRTPASHQLYDLVEALDFSDADVRWLLKTIAEKR
tara:strand:- start:621 stop:926 length:306 start_codon:yes stop_codon:yes gene_type:complete